MKKSLFFLVILLSFLLSGFSSSADNQGGLKIAPASADNNVWDFGRVPPGNKVKHEFILKNQSPILLNIKDISTSCGCTASNAKKKILKPQEETSVNVQFDSTGYSGFVQQYVYVTTDNPKDPVTRFIIKADVQK